MHGNLTIDQQPKVTKRQNLCDKCYETMHRYEQKGITAKFQSGFQLEDRKRNT